MARGYKEELNFRDLTSGLVLIINDRNLELIKKSDFEHQEYDNAILACGYIDHTAGITFEVLCLGEYGPRGEIDIRRGNSSISLKLRYDSINGYIVLLDDASLPALRSKIDMVRGTDSAYRVNDDIMKARNSVIFDDFRHPQFPDDVVLYFFKEGLQLEGIWCRIEKEVDGKPAAVMMNEPNQDLGCHQGDMVTFGWTKNNEGKMVGIAELPPIKKSRNSTLDILDK